MKETVTEKPNTHHTNLSISNPDKSSRSKTPPKKTVVKRFTAIKKHLRALTLDTHMN